MADSETIPSVEKGTLQEYGQHEKNTIALSSVIAAIFLTTMKLIVGILTGSLGILAEAAHSALDLMAAGMTYFAVRISSRPADRDHTYGHGKVENLSALFETLLLLVTCLWIIYEAIQRLFFKTIEIEASIWAFMVMAISIVVDVSRSRALYRVARKYESQALEADALHFSTDVWSSSVVIVGLFLVFLSKQLQLPWLAKADAIAAVGVAFIVIFISLQLGRRTIFDLLDSTTPELYEKVIQSAQVEGVQEIKRVRIRRSGPQVFVDITLTVLREVALERAHQISDAVEASVRSLIPRADVVVHIEPITPSNEDVITTVRVLAARNGLGAHSIRFHDLPQSSTLEMHLEVSDRLTLEQAHERASNFEEALRKEMPEIHRIVTHIEPVNHQSQAEPESESRESLILQAFDSLTEATGIKCHPHDIQIYTENKELCVSFHCINASNISINEAHALAEKVEQFLRARVPNLGRVVIHMEPEGVESS
jgi:cation diffusion facilitator family transporter